MTVYTNEEGKICIQKSLSERIQRESGYYIVSDSLFLRVTALKKEDECFPPLSDSMYIIETYLTSKYKNLILAVYKYSNSDLMLLMRLDRPSLKELVENMKKLGIKDDVINKLINELELAVPAPQS